MGVAWNADCWNAESIKHEGLFVGAKCLQSAGDIDNSMFWNCRTSSTVNLQQIEPVELYLVSRIKHVQLCMCTKQLTVRTTHHMAFAETECIS